jgi:hypothetical protein
MRSAIGIRNSSSQRGSASNTKPECRFSRTVIACGTVSASTSAPRSRA